VSLRWKRTACKLKQQLMVDGSIFNTPFHDRDPETALSQWSGHIGELLREYGSGNYRCQ